MAEDQVDAHASANAQETTVTIVGAIMIVLAVIAVILRFYTRHRMKAAFSWDDWMALAAVVPAVAAGVLVLVGKYFCIPIFENCLPQNADEWLKYQMSK